MGDALKFARKLVAVLPRADVEKLIREGRAGSRPHLSNLTDLRDQLVLMVAHAGETRERLYAAVRRLAGHD